MKRLYFVGGTMGIGKTAACQALKRRLPRCVFLDGDWCWDMRPFVVTQETKAMVLDNITHLLNNFLACSELDNILFCWVMHEQSIIDELLSRLTLTDVRVTEVSLICDEACLRARLQGDVNAGLREADVIERSIARLPLYRKLRTALVDVSALDVEQTADRILKL